MPDGPKWRVNESDKVELINQDAEQNVINYTAYQFPLISNLKNKQTTKRKHYLPSFMVELHYCPDSSAG